MCAMPGSVGPNLRRLLTMPDSDDAAEIDAVIRALARDEHRAPALAARLVIGERDLHRGVDRLRPRVGEEDAVQVARRQLRDARRELELLRMRRAVNGAHEVELAQLRADRVGDLLAAVAGGDAEQARRRVDDLVAAVVPVVHAFGAHDHLRIGLEVAVRRERHPVFVERDRFVAAWSWIVSSAWPIVISWLLRNAKADLNPTLVRQAASYKFLGHR